MQDIFYKKTALEYSITNPSLCSVGSLTILETPAPYGSEPPRYRFLSSVHEVSPNLYSFHAQDLFHELRYSLKLESQNWLNNGNEKIRAGSSFAPMIVCDFPTLYAQNLYKSIQGDDYLYENITKQFYLYIFESLLLFCIEKEAKGLTLFVEDPFRNLLEIYRPFILKERETHTEKEKTVCVTIVTDQETYNSCAEYRKEFAQQFLLGLWKRQHENPAIREYLQNLQAWEYMHM